MTDSTSSPRVDGGTAPAAAAPSGQSGHVLRSSPLRRLLKSPTGLIALVILAGVVLMALLAPLLTSQDPNHADLTAVLLPPGGDHLLGTDSAGRDIWARLVFGSRLTLAAAAVAAVVAIAIGLPSGLVAGYYGGIFDGVANWSTNVLMSLPAIIVLLAVRAAVGPSVWISMVIFGVLLSPGYYRLTRTAVQSVRNELYVDAARVSGLSDGRIISRHVLSVVRAPIIIQTAIVAGLSITVASSLDFLGLGDPTVPTWGVMVSDGFKNIYRQPISLLWSSLAITLVIGGFVLLGNALRDSLEDLEKTKEKRAKPAGGRRARPVAVEVGTEHHLLKVTDLQVAYPQPRGGRKVVVDGVSFHVDRDEVVGIVGESGSGKSQTAFSILGLLPDNAILTRGAIQFDGAYTVAPGEDHVTQSRLAPLRGKRIGYIPQEPMSNLDPAFTIGAQLSRPMVTVMGLSKKAAKQRALQLLASVGIPDPNRTYHAYPHEVSGGMAQRVLIAGAISCEPDLIIADEPTTALDVTVQAEVLDVMRELQQRLKIGIIIVTHNFGVVADMCDRVLVMQDGSLVETGAVRQILHAPQHPYTRMLLSSMLEGKTPMTHLLADSTAGSDR
ncbi:dipeptide/oligopeptide/nickel ABC transporter permease/ATP-binding protein [Isoptericola sp. b441]|uniref:Dipeptide/oligopeptide/nickel ABC transporter permease/ATP-binding protein n=1 Tax=Actinotalea lenta TaxID=3064654 RepID=A0ABT9DAS3_9CELL|nr:MULTISPECIES: dipeptide/oligopeptide/nickel ABC transporter permease/ATP-binding protein [unclassified Isoptericola]MDO8108007.1 dipeptide/oligopeptide/nickel ABC transporter permease/ATP-binding protein [Isoptericola sp. b441]MDO8120323.1 dipeptide/oligopeptide/nickel ABC transporter permease/ATP-binding protein [Isoptericola sp. b490]